MKTVVQQGGTKSVTDILKLARQLLAEPGVWIQHKLSLDVAMQPVAWFSNRAVHFDAMGAVVRSSGNAGTPNKSTDQQNAEVEACILLESCIPDPNNDREWFYMRDSSASLAEYNDPPSTTHADILALFDMAIAKAEAM